MVRVAHAAALAALTVPAYAALIPRQGVPDIKSVPASCTATCQPLVSKVTDGCFQSLACSCNRTFELYLRSCAQCVQSADPTQINATPDQFVQGHSNGCTAGGYPIDPNGDITLTSTRPTPTSGPPITDSGTVSGTGPTVTGTGTGVTSKAGVTATGTGTGTNKPANTGTSGGTGTGSGGTSTGGTGSGSGSGGSSSGGSGSGSGGGNGSSGTSSNSAASTTWNTFGVFVAAVVLVAGFL